MRGSEGLQVTGARYAAKGATILDGLDLHVAAGEVVGLLGPNGSGKSTLLKAIVGAVPTADIGVVVDGHDLTRSRSLRAQRVALVEQQAPETSLTVRDIVYLGRTPYQRSFAALSGVDHDQVRDAMRRTGTLPFERRPFSTLSGGERQRVHIARALAQTTPYLLLDEPTNHLDLAAQMEILALIDAVADAGVGVLLAIHDLTHASILCDRIILLDHGRIVDQGPPYDVLTPRTIARVFGVNAQWLNGSDGRALVTTMTRTRRPPARSETAIPLKTRNLNGR